MEQISNQEELKAAIRRLEQQRLEQEKELKLHFEEVLNELRPGNLVKNAVRDAVGGSGMAGKIANASLSLASGYFSRKLVLGKAGGQLLGGALQAGVTGLAGKFIPRIAGGIARLFKKRKNV